MGAPVAPRRYQHQPLAADVFRGREAIEQRRKIGGPDAFLAGFGGDVDLDQAGLRRAARLEGVQQGGRIDRVNERDLAGHVLHLVALERADEVPFGRHGVRGQEDGLVA